LKELGEFRFREVRLGYVTLRYNTISIVGINRFSFGFFLHIPYVVDS